LSIAARVPVKEGCPLPQKHTARILTQQCRTPRDGLKSQDRVADTLVHYDEAPHYHVEDIVRNAMSPMPGQLEIVVGLVVSAIVAVGKMPRSA
jgi:hypothetical protein